MCARAVCVLQTRQFSPARPFFIFQAPRAAVLQRRYAISLSVHSRTPTTPGACGRASHHLIGPLIAVSSTAYLADGS